MRHQDKKQESLFTQRHSDKDIVTHKNDKGEENLEESQKLLKEEQIWQEKSENYFKNIKLDPIVEDKNRTNTLTSNLSNPLHSNTLDQPNNNNLIADFGYEDSIKDHNDLEVDDKTKKSDELINDNLEVAGNNKQKNPNEMDLSKNTDVKTHSFELKETNIKLNNDIKKNNNE